MLLKEAIFTLKQLDIDGETMEHIIDVVGLRDQMLRQLVMNASIEELQNLLEERKELENRNS